MAITVIRGPEGSGRRSLAETIRNTAIMNGRGALLLSDREGDAEVEALVEKLIQKEKLPKNVAEYQAIRDGEVVTGFDALPWKKDPHIVCVDDPGVEVLKKIEARVPGFADRFGPVASISTSIEEIDLG